ncbi:hypothetical protein [Mycetocola zhadangensis]|uniref:Uncharacterized protein n=1 Tax=Mycetocola zhadangensis TaxID=1164595 RepID=A0A3L7ITG1_9MICO|nr:hypothetical protein [Mycetocola zhadangensis]RLQ81459.1 hypothetical protein D9V28_13995 [Mycetocola zhadangensis]GGF01464.1 hypothetical protein GCM10011313_25760 [Mycetocola zhadangensis]
MTESASIERPPRSTPLRAYAGEIHAAPVDVFAALERHLRAESEGTGIAVDAAGRFIVVQGGWWYRAEYRVLASENGARIEHELLNVALTAHWAGPLAGQKVLRDSPAAFGALLTAMAAELEG